MAEIVIYTRSWCGYCRAAKRLLGELEVEYQEKDVEDPALYREMVERADGRTTVPEIFIDGECIGGYSELRALEEAGKLRSMLGLEAG